MFNIYYDAPLRLLLNGIMAAAGVVTGIYLLCVMVFLGFSAPSMNEVAKMRGL